MALLRVRVELQRQAKGIEMPKLVTLAREAQKFLKMLATDTGIRPDGVWVAQGFYDQGLGFDATLQRADIDERQAQDYIHTLDRVTSLDTTSNWYVPRVRPETLIQSAKVAQVAGEDEVIRLGFYANGDKPPAVQWRPLSHSRAAAILEHFRTWVSYRGMAQGVIHSLYKESEPPYFDLRDIATNALVKCYYSDALYEDVVSALEDKNAVVIVAGWITARRSDRTISKITADKLRALKPLSRKSLEAFFGSAPGWTGDLTTEDFIDRARNPHNGDA
jgi:hypothetical protein